MPGGRARGNPAQIFSENSQKFPSTDLKNILYFDISMYPSYIWHMNFGQSPLGLDFGVFGPLWEITFLWLVFELGMFKVCCSIVGSQK